MDDDPERAKPELDALAARANEALRSEPAIDLRLLSASPRLYDDNGVGLSQIRSEALAILGGGEFRFDVTFGEHKDHGALVKELIQAARHFMSTRSSIAQSIQQARAATLAAIDRHDCSCAPVKVVAVGVCAGTTMLACLDVVVELEVLGHNLSPVISRVRADTVAELAKRLEEVLARQKRRSLLRASFQANRARGSIEEMARGIISSAGVSLSFVLEHLQRRSTLSFKFGCDGGHQFARLYWREGILKADFRNYVNTTDFIGDELIVYRALPMRIISARVGRRLGKLVDDRHIPGDAVVVDARRDYEQTTLTLVLPSASLPLHPGRAAIGRTPPSR